MFSIQVPPTGPAFSIIKYKSLFDDIIENGNKIWQKA